MHMCHIGVENQIKQYVTLIITLPPLQLLWTIHKAVPLFIVQYKRVSCWSAILLKWPIRVLCLSTGNHRHLRCRWRLLLVWTPATTAAGQPGFFFFIYILPLMHKQTSHLYSTHAYSSHRTTWSSGAEPHPMEKWEMLRVLLQTSEPIRILGARSLLLTR